MMQPNLVFEINDNEHDLTYYKKCQYSPITSCDVERLFWQYTNIFTDKRMSLSRDHLKWLMVSFNNKCINFHTKYIIFRQKHTILMFFFS